MDLGEGVDRCWNAHLARLDLQRQHARVEAGENETAYVEPQRPLLRRLPQIPDFAFPGARIAGDASGSSTRHSAASGGSPSAAADSRREPGIPVSPACVFRTIGSRL